MIVYYDINTGDITRAGTWDVDLNPPSENEAQLEAELVSHFDVFGKQVDLATGKLVARTEFLWAQVRQQRDNLLSATDYLVMPDYPISDSYRQQVLAYRQALRDLTTAFADPTAVVYPTRPSKPTQS